MSSGGVDSSGGGGPELPPPLLPTLPAQPSPSPTPLPAATPTRTAPGRNAPSPLPTIVPALRAALGMGPVEGWGSAGAFYALVQTRLPDALRFPPGHARAGDALKRSNGTLHRGALVVEAAQYYVKCQKEGTAPHGGSAVAVGRRAAAAPATAAAPGGSGAAAGAGLDDVSGYVVDVPRLVMAGLKSSALEALGRMLHQRQKTRETNEDLCGTIESVRDFAVEVFDALPDEYPPVSCATKFVGLLQHNHMLPVAHDVTEVTTTIEEARRSSMTHTRNHMARDSCQKLYFRQHGTPDWSTVKEDVNIKLILEMSPDGAEILKGQTVGGNEPPWPRDRTPPDADHMEAARQVRGPHACTDVFPRCAALTYTLFPRAGLQEERGAP